MRKVYPCSYCGGLYSHKPGCNMPRCKECGRGLGSHTNLCSKGPNLLNEERIPDYLPPYFNDNGFLFVDLNPVYLDRTRRDLAKLLAKK